MARFDGSGGIRAFLSLTAQFKLTTVPALAIAAAPRLPRSAAEARCHMRRFASTEQVAFRSA